MAKKPPQDLEPSALEDPFDGPGLPDTPPAPPPPLRTGPTCGQFVGGLLEIILIAVIGLMVCGLISGAAVWLGEDRGLIPDNPPTAAVSLLAQIPTVAPLNVPTLPVTPAPERTADAVPTAAPDSTAPDATPLPPDTACANGAAWWRDSQPLFDSIAAALPATRFGAESASALAARLSPAREALITSEPPLCLEAPHAALVAALDAALGGLNTAEGGDVAAYTAQANRVNAELATVLNTLWDDGVFTAPEAASTRSVARGSAGDCAPDAWYADLTEQVTQFRTEAAAADPNTVPVISVNLGIGKLNGILEATTALTAPGCVADIGRYTTDWMAASIDLIRAQLAADATAARDAANRAGQAAVLLRAWQDWLGLAAT